MDETERLAAIWARMVAVLQDVVREFNITQDELHTAAEYLTRAAHAGVMRSLVDVALSMTSVDAFQQANTTRSNPEGPYYRPGAPIRPDGVLLERPTGETAKSLTVRGRVTDAESGEPLANAELDLWQADECGNYDHVGFHLRGRVRADGDGAYEFTTLVPAEYTEHDEDPIGELFTALGRHNYRAAHIHLKVHVDGQERLTTQLYMADARHIDSDYVIGAVSADLIVNRQPLDSRKSVATFDLAVPSPERPQERR
ncbi:MAG TPA: dioxygenase [Streptosporangiaceae bacterium]|nr:dioxygenase [Streptosporangiaceae bacterium]